MLRIAALAGAFVVSISALRAAPEVFSETLAAPYQTGPISDVGTAFGASATTGAWTWSISGLEPSLSQAKSAGADLLITLNPSYAPGTHVLSFTTTVLAGAEVFHFGYGVSTLGGGSVEWVTNGVASALTGRGTFDRTFAAGDVVGFRLTTEYGGNPKMDIYVGSFSASADPAAIPEPATTAAWLAGAAGLLVLRLRRRREPATA